LRRNAGVRCAAAVMAAVMVCGVGAQEIRLGLNRPAAKGHVLLLSDAVEVMAGKAQTVELRFRVDDGFHINSHTPKDELLLPTVFRVDAESAVKGSDLGYPKGTPFRLALDTGGGEVLDVYQGEFRVSMRVTAPKGASTLVGSLKYQACDNAACFPPLTLPVRVAVTAR
jgi:hypothetical protein